MHLRACIGAYNSQCLILFNCEMCTKKNKIPTIYTSARNVSFSFLIISQVGYIHSIHAVSETMSDSSARNVFFSFLIISQVGCIHSFMPLVKHCLTVLLGTFFFSNNVTGGLCTFKPCV